MIHMPHDHKLEFITLSSSVYLNAWLHAEGLHVATSHITIILMRNSSNIGKFYNYLTTLCIAIQLYQLQKAIASRKKMKPI